MIKIKTVSDKEIQGIKEKHVLNCFTDYLYHKHVVDQIQEELNYISEELSCGSSSMGIIRVSKDAKNNNTPWQNELFARESDLIKEQDKHFEHVELVDEWLKNIKNETHRDILIDYVINNHCENAESVAENCYTTKGNVCKVAQRLITKIARRIS
ncbi:MAG: hypothetical protein RR945_02840 [Erysipelotrichaceae bacterium]